MKKIGIIGGGYTGLTAAYELSKLGYAVEIFEAGNNLGGLAGGFNVGGTSLEKAYHHIFKTDTDIISLATELGVDSKILWHESSVSLFYDGVLYPFKGALDLIRFKPLSFVNRIRAGLTVLYLQRTGNWKQFENVTAYDWMLKFAGPEVTAVIWEPLLKGKFDTYFDKVSMAWLWARIHVRAQSRESGGEKLGYFDGGFDVFTSVLVKELKKRKVVIHTDSQIAAIESLKKPQLTLADGTVRRFDSVLATTPSHVFAKLIGGTASAKYISRLNSVNYLGACLLIFTSKQKISPYYWHNINDLGIPFLVFINHTELIDKSNYGNQYVYYIGSYIPHDHKYFTMTDQQIISLWFSGLKKIFPRFDRTKVGETNIFKFRNAQHIVEVNYSSTLPDYSTPLKSVYLSNFSQIYPEDRGTNYAVREGRKIANIIDSGISS